MSNTLHERLKTTPPSERADLRAEAASKAKTGRFTINDLEIDVRSIRKVPNGIEVMAQVWKDSKQLGFGADYSVDIERFRFFNPPVLVDSEDGDIVKEYATEGFHKTRKLKEDPDRALLEMLAEASTVGRPGTITPGKVGNTTSTIYPSYDAYFQPAGAANFAASRALTTAAVDATTGNLLAAGCRNDGVGAYRIVRSGIVFDTSVVGSDTISSAVLSLFSFFHTDNDNDAQAYITIDTFTPASDAGFVGGDWDNFGGDKQTSDVDITGVTDETYSAFTYIDYAEINTAGNTRVMVREGHDYENSASPLAIGEYSRVHFYQSDESGTTKDPVIVLSHSAAAATGHTNLPILGAG